MQSIWIFSENNEISKQLITLGKEAKQTLQKELYVLTLDEDFANQISSYDVDKVYLLKGSNCEILRPESLAKGLSKLVEEENPLVLFIGGTLRGKELAAKIAALSDISMITDANNVNFDNDIITERTMYGGLAVLTEKLVAKTIVTIPPKAYESAQAGSSSVEIITKEIEVEQNLEVIETSAIKREGVDLTSATRVVCVGRGVNNKEDLALANNLAALIGGDVGCTRSIAEDYHWLAEEAYIGLSGVNIQPELYISMGVSGQVQHTSGIRDSKIIVAVDTNENAPIFEAADYGIVGDLYEVIPALTEALKSVMGK